ncbi:hypothetical protein G7008_16440 [Pseudomonas psychrotolerans]|uniref:hypothetical protein n=1 Tax=Pseudomonas oryzihabitans TaxID=47885 RepID=UPI0011105DF8|nr:hypothetical protein [Pseudomonas psychrotolerans]MBA1182097.1 hypothetical protein [Pseudomonas psychrotolerans]MBA1211451.1 hypothetical protein [Pseudomonas psychrotolerans]
MKLIFPYTLVILCSIVPALALASPASPGFPGANSSPSSNGNAARDANKAKFCQQYRARLASGNIVIPKAEALCQAIGR